MFLYAGRTVKTNISKQDDIDIIVEDNHGTKYPIDNLLIGTGLEEDYVFEEARINIATTKDISYSCIYMKKNDDRPYKPLVFNTTVLMKATNVPRTPNIFNDIHFYRHAIERCNADPENEVLKKQLRHYQEKLVETLQIDYPTCTAEEIAEKYDKIDRYVKEIACPQTNINMQ